MKSGIDSIPPLFIAATGSPNMPPDPSDCSAMENVVRTEIEKDSWHDVLPSQEGVEEVTEDICDNCTLQTCQKKCHSDTFCTRNVLHAPLVQAAGLRDSVRQNGAVRVIITVSGVGVAGCREAC